ncbi:ATP-binding cassette domain-containing protein [Telmatospirillum sp. J64-1]|uniref:ATP-binding cassette domain-containing protein n=1 Tax=Telmatospirillum sp. J64-1 TaxID=2502183 RepID=UPI00115C5857|nr:ATP-binding cassette domain-containing protein [Telmatospirillum sp. J64-1]
MRNFSILPLELCGVSFSAGGKKLIHDIDLMIEDGPATILLGPNGAGKSLLLRLCHGLLQPTTGQVIWRDLGRHMPKLHAMVFQRPVMLRRSAAANIDYALKLNGICRQSRKKLVAEALELAGLSDQAQTPARVLSGGQQQRLAIARAWACRPQVLFLDEPTASLDPQATKAVETLIGQVQESGTKIIMTTHDLGQARRLAGEVLFLHSGRLIEHRPAEPFFSGPATSEARAFLAGDLLW